MEKSYEILKTKRRCFIEIENQLINVDAIESIRSCNDGTAIVYYVSKRCEYFNDGDRLIKKINAAVLAEPLTEI